MSTEIVLDDLREYVVKAGPMERRPDGQQMILKFPNGYGASIVRHHFSYGNELGLFELAVIKWTGDKMGDDWDLCYTTPITDGVLGHLTPEDVVSYLLQIKAL